MFEYFMANKIEFVATLAGLLCVILVVKQNIANWIIGLVQVVLYAYIFYGAKLYSDMILQIIWIPVQFYGFYKWLNKTKNVPLPVSSMHWMDTLTWAIGGIIFSMAIGVSMDTFTDAAAPFVDALILGLSLVATYLLSLKKIQNWYFWFVVDILSVGLFWNKNLHFTAGLYAVYLVLVVIGYFKWKKDLVDA